MRGRGSWEDQLAEIDDFDFLDLRPGAIGGADAWEHASAYGLGRPVAAFTWAFPFPHSASKLAHSTRFATLPVTPRSDTS